MDKLQSIDGRGRKRKIKIKIEKFEVSDIFNELKINLTGDDVFNLKWISYKTLITLERNRRLR